MKYKIVICLLCTKKYHVFAQPLIDSICKYFLLNHKIEIQLFTDDTTKYYYGCKRVSIVKTKIPSYGFPEITLFRYAIMTSKTYDCDYLYYLDIDYLIVSEIDEEIFGDIVAVLHPGFAMVGGGSWCDDENCNAYTLPENRKHYFAGGTAGGRYKNYYRLMQRLKEDIDEDEKRGVKAIWHDESYWNKALSQMQGFKILDSSYCMPEPISLIEAWKLTHLTPRILALEKDHASIRS